MIPIYCWQLLVLAIQVAVLPSLKRCFTVHVKLPTLWNTSLTRKTSQLTLLLFAIFYYNLGSLLQQ
jgi:hypothetical protein